MDLGKPTRFNGTAIDTAVRTGELQSTVFGMG